MAFAQQQPGPAVVPLSITPDQCWTSGSGASYFKACISRHGNVVTLQSPSGLEHIGVGQIIEGYVACARSSATGSVLAYYDAGVTHSGWAEPYKVTTSPAKVYRKTTDGKLELVQQFSFDGAEFDLTVTMTLYNRSGRTLYDVRLDRYADFDVNNTWTDDLMHRSPRASFGWETGMLVSLTDLSALTSASSIQAMGGGWGISTCNAASVDSPPAPGDWIGRVSYNFGTLAAGASKAVKLLYRVE